MSSLLVSAVARRSISSLLRQNVRMFCTPVETPKATNPGVINADGRSKTHKVDSLERRMLVWTGKYKTTEEVPTFVNQETMERARNRIRIRLANIMMALTALGCIIMIWSGKKAADRGESVHKQNLDWHKEYNDQRIAEVEAARASQKNK